MNIKLSRYLSGSTERFFSGTKGTTVPQPANLSLNPCRRTKAMACCESFPSVMDMQNGTSAPAPKSTLRPAASLN